MTLVHEFRIGACAVALAAAGAASATTVSLLNNGSFEEVFQSGTFCHSLSSTDTGLGNWAWGDSACASLAASGITPLDGLRMLDFLPVPVGNISADVYQVVDLSAYAADIDAGLATVDTSAYFNATGTARVGMGLFARNTATGPLKLLAGAYDEFTTDADRSTWQQFGHTDVALPTGARYLFFGLNTPAAYTAGAYADQASMLLHIAGGSSDVPEPGALALVAAALLGARAARRRARLAVAGLEGP